MSIEGVGEQNAEPEISESLIAEIKEREGTNPEIKLDNEAIAKIEADWLPKAINILREGGVDLSKKLDCEVVVANYGNILSPDERGVRAAAGLGIKVWKMRPAYPGKYASKGESVFLVPPVSFERSAEIVMMQLIDSLGQNPLTYGATPYDKPIDELISFEKESIERCEKDVKADPKKSGEKISAYRKELEDLMFLKSLGAERVNLFGLHGIAQRIKHRIGLMKEYEAIKKIHG